MEFLTPVLPYVPAIVSVIVMALIALGLRKISIRADLKEQIEALVQRGLDKGGQWWGIATSPTGDGGTKITAAEASVLRQKLWEFCKEEVTGPAAKMLLSLGEEIVKGWIGKVIGAKVEVVNAAPPAPQQG